MAVGQVGVSASLKYNIDISALKKPYLCVKKPKLQYKTQIQVVMTVYSCWTYEYIKIVPRTEK